MSALAYAFWRPRGIFRFAGLAALAAIGLPFVLAYGLAPFAGEGAGMGDRFHALCVLSRNRDDSDL